MKTWLYFSKQHFELALLNTKSLLFYKSESFRSGAIGNYKASLRCLAHAFEFTFACLILTVAIVALTIL